MKTSVVTIVGLFITYVSLAQATDKYQRLVDSLKKSGQAEKLIPYFQNELKTHPKSEDVLRWLGALYIENKQLDLGEKYYSRALEVAPKCVTCYIKLARIAATKKDNNKATQLLDKAISIEPGNAHSYWSRGCFREDLGNNSGALDDYEKAISLEPKNTTYILSRADLCAKQGLKEAAQADYDLVVAMDKDYNAYTKRAEWYYGLEKYERSLLDIDSAGRIDSNRMELYAAKGAVYLSMKDYVRSEAAYSQSIKLSPKDYQLYYSRAHIRYLMEDMDGACADNHASYDALKQQDPKDSFLLEIAKQIDDFCDPAKPNYYYQRGVAFYNLKEFSKATAIYSEGLKKFPGHRMMTDFRGNAYIMAGDFNNAIIDYTSIIDNNASLAAELGANYRNTELSPYELEQVVKSIVGSAFFDRANAKAGLGKYEEALDDVDKAIAFPFSSKTVSKGPFYQLRATIYLIQGNYNLALKNFDTAITKDPARPIAWIYRALTRFCLSPSVKTQQKIIGEVDGGMLQVKTNLPIWTNASATDLNIIAAIADCDRAIRIEPKMGYAYYIRGQLKRMVNNNSACTDLLKAQSLGYPVELDLMKGCSK